MMTIKKYIYQKAAVKNIPVSGSFEITPRCNFNCKMCYIRMSAEEQKQRGCELTADEWIAIGKQAAAAGMVYLLITGGEPFLRPDFCKIYSELVKMGLLVSVNTNAALLNDEIIECFKKYKPERVNVTLYADTDDTLKNLCRTDISADIVKNNIDRLLDSGILVSLNATFTKLNISEMPDIIAFGEKRKLPVRMTEYVFPPVRGGHVSDEVERSPEEAGKASALFDKLTLNAQTVEKRRELVLKCINGETVKPDESECKAKSCMAGKSSFWISWDGKMFPCGMLPGYSVDIRSYDFVDAWHNISGMAKNIAMPKECLNCKYRDICSNCAAVFESTTGSSDKIYLPYCKKTMAYADSFLSNRE